MDSEEDPETPPRTHIRWFHAGHGLGHLDLLATPIVTKPASAASNTWTPFTRDESDHCEAAWHALSDAQRARALGGDPALPVAAPVINEDDEEELMLGVPIGKERLFEVDVRTLRMYSVYWTITGPPIPVLRAVWMHDQNRPVALVLSQELETAYLAIQPWKSSYEDELHTAAEIGASAYEKLRYPLPSTDASVFFDDAFQARIISNSFSWSSLFSPFRSATQSRQSPYASAQVVYRGFDEAVQRALPPPKRPGTPGPTGPRTASSPSSPAARPSALPGPGSGPATATPTPRPGPGQEHSIRPQSLDGKLVDLKKRVQKKATTGNNNNNDDVTRPFTDREEATMESRRLAEADEGGREQPGPSGAKVGEGASQDVTDLVLIIHGIGQGLTAQYESFNFVYVTNMFRQAARKQAQSPALASIMRSGNVQFLPVQWRTTLRLDEDEARKRKMDGLDNSFSLADITLKKHIPVVRELTNEVLIDIPYFMSHHQSRMIESVCAQANRLYRLWCARNPDFSKNGRVHILAHSLGSALAANILSNQPTTQPPLEDFTLEEIKQKTETQFLFNTSALFMIGSPLGVFLHLNQAQLIARKGRERTMNSPDDEALDRVGLFGCLAIDSLYNIYNPSDPVAYKLNATVDAKRAKDLPVHAIPNINESIFNMLSKNVSKMFNFGQPANQQPIGAGGSGGDEETTVELELGGGPEKLQGDRAERRFMALNRHGCIDFFLPAEGSISEYVDMITAHSGYWGDGSLAGFILAEIFARREDLVRTGLGPSVMPDT